MEFDSVSSAIAVQNHGDQNHSCGAYYVGAANDEVTDEVLVFAARSGDSGAFNVLYERYARKVSARIYLIMRNRQDTEDVLQEAALRAFVHLKRFEGRSSFQTWFTSIAINSALMGLRRRRGTEISIEEMSDEAENSRHWEPPDNAETPEARYARCESEAMLKGAIRQLPCMFREIVELQQSDDYSTTQIAQQLGISDSAAKSRLMRARKKLRRSLNRPGPLRFSNPVQPQPLGV